MLEYNTQKEKLALRHGAEVREKQTDEGQEAPIQPQIALTTEKKPASFNVSAIGLQYVLVCSITIRVSPPSF